MSLSDRIRPNCEAAPWVIEEVKKLEADNAQYREDFRALQKRLTEGDRELAKTTAALKLNQQLRKKAEDDLARAITDRDLQRRKFTAEFEAHKLTVSDFDGIKDALRARVAELEEKAERYRLVTLRQDAANAELVAALRPIYALRKNCEGDIGWRGQKDAKVGWVTVRDILALEQALARAESAAPTDSSTRT